MNLAWCMIALALTGTDDPTSIKTPTPNARAVGAPAALSTLSKTCHLTCGAAPAPLAKQIEPAAEEIWPMTLRQAVRIALDNSEIVRVIAFGQQSIPVANCFGPPTEPKPRPLLPADLLDGVKYDGKSIVIARLNADASSFRFKSEVMAIVRSVEQQYWSLAQAHAALWAADRRVNEAQDVVVTEQNKLTPCHGGIGDLAEVSDRFERLEHNLIELTEDVIAAERRFREILGLPKSDNRRIIPVTPPTQARLEPDWESCLDAMMHQQPDVIQQKALTRLAELQLLVARHAGLTDVNRNTLDQLNARGQMLDGPEEALMSTFRDGLELGSPKKLNQLKARFAGSSASDSDVLELLTSEAAATAMSPPTPHRNSRAPLANTRQAQYKLLRSRAFLRQVVHQTTHSLARGFLEVDANYKCYAKGKGVRDTAEKQLAAQRTYWEQGRITPVRFLDAVDEYAAAVAAENQYLATYNTAIAFLSECKGTLLEDHNIIVVERHRRGQSDQTFQTAQDDQSGTE
jgi:outer membrane protein TolC